MLRFKPIKQHPVKNGETITWGPGTRGVVDGYNNGAYMVRNEQSIAGIRRTIRFNVTVDRVEGVAIA